MTETPGTSGDDGSHSASPRAWAHLSEDDGFIIGSRENLERLREHLETALKHGESPANDDHRLEFSGVRVVEDLPTPQPQSAGQEMATLGCLGVALLLVAACLIGLWTILDWVFRDWAFH